MKKYGKRNKQCMEFIFYKFYVNMYFTVHHVSEKASKIIFVITMSNFHQI